MNVLGGTRSLAPCHISKPQGSYLGPLGRKLGCVPRWCAPSRMTTVPRASDDANSDEGKGATTKTKEDKPKGGIDTKPRMDGPMPLRTSGRRGPMPPLLPGGGPPRGPTTTQVIAGHAAYIGFMGTVAVAAAQALNINLVNMFQWGDYQDYKLALELMIPLQALNVLLLLPDWSSWQLPKPAALTQEQQARTAASLAAAVAATSPGASSSSTSSSSLPVTPAAPITSPLDHGPSSGTNTSSATEAGASGERTVLRSAPLGPPPGLPKDAVAVGTEEEERGSTAAPPAPPASSSSDAMATPASSSSTTVNSSRGTSPNPHSPSSSSASGSSTTSGSPPPRLPSPPLDGKIKLVDAKMWGSAPPPVQPPQMTQGLPSARTLRDAAHLAQGYYVSNNPTANVSPLIEAGVGTLDSLASEMMFRGVIVGGLAQFVRDRAYEQGADDFIALPPAIAQLMGPEVFMEGGAALEAAAAGLQMVDLDDVARYLAGLGVVLMVGLLAGRRVQRSRRQVAMVSDITERISSMRDKVKAGKGGKKGAGSTPASASTASTGEGAGKAVGEEKEGAAGPGTSGISSTPIAPSATATGIDAPTATTATTPNPSATASSGTPLPVAPGLEGDGAASKPTSSSAPSTSGPKGMAGSSLPPRPPKSSKPQIGQSSSAPVAGPSPSGSKADEKEGEKKPRVLVGVMPGGGGMPGMPQGQPVLLNPGAGPLDAIAWATTLQSTRDTLQTVTLTAIFVASGGNLAASFAASTLNQLVFSVLQRIGMERTRQRSAELAAEMEEINAKLRSIVKKREGEIKANGGKVPPPNLPGLDGSSGSSSSPSGSSGSSAPASGSANGVPSASNGVEGGATSPTPVTPAPEAMGPPHTEAATTLAVDAGAVPGHEHGQQPVPPAPTVAAAPASTEPPAPATRMQRTLTALDSLLPPEPPKKKK